MQGREVVRGVRQGQGGDGAAEEVAVADELIPAPGFAPGPFFFVLELPSAGFAERALESGQRADHGVTLDRERDADVAGHAEARSRAP